MRKNAKENKMKNTTNKAIAQNTNKAAEKKVTATAVQSQPKKAEKVTKRDEAKKAMQEVKTNTSTLLIDKVKNEKMTVVEDSKHHATRLTVKYGKRTVCEIVYKPKTSSYSIAIRQTFADAAKLEYDLKEKWGLKANIVGLNRNDLVKTVVKTIKAVESLEKAVEAA